MWFFYPEATVLKYFLFCYWRICRASGLLPLTHDWLSLCGTIKLWLPAWHLIMRIHLSCLDTEYSRVSGQVHSEWQTIMKRHHCRHSQMCTPCLAFYLCREFEEQEKIEGAEIWTEGALHPFACIVWRAFHSSPGRTGVAQNRSFAVSRDVIAGKPFWKSPSAFSAPQGHFRGPQISADALI